jgi:hypothetical protein
MEAIPCHFQNHQGGIEFQQRSTLTRTKDEAPLVPDVSFGHGAVRAAADGIPGSEPS